MRGILLAAGYGTRLRPLTISDPKCLIPIKGKKIIEYWIDLLIQNGLQHIVINRKQSELKQTL